VRFLTSPCGLCEGARDLSHGDFHCVVGIRQVVAGDRLALSRNRHLLSRRDTCGTVLLPVRLYHLVDGMRPPYVSVTIHIEQCTANAKRLVPPDNSKSCVLAEPLPFNPLDLGPVH
jgi:hypothetical protein